MENYKIIKFLNKGSYGKVYLVEKLSCESKFALKCIDILNDHLQFTIRIKSPTEE